MLPTHLWKEIKMNESTSQVCNILINELENKTFVELFYDNKFEKLILTIIGLSVIFFVSTIFFENTKNFAYISALVFLFFIFLYSLATSISSFLFIKNPVKFYLKNLIGNLKKESFVISQLSEKDPESLKATYERLEFESNKLNSRVCFLVGALDKVGIIPGLIALYFAFIEGTGESNFNNIPDVILTFLVGLYAGAFISRRITGRIENMIFILKLSEKRSLRLQQFEIKSGLS